jgi:hypothetical protein
MARAKPELRPSGIALLHPEENVVEPEQSTSAIVVHHPGAKYFVVRKRVCSPDTSAPEPASISTRSRTAPFRVHAPLRFAEGRTHHVT